MRLLNTAYDIADMKFDFINIYMKFEISVLSDNNESQRVSYLKTRHIVTLNRKPHKRNI